MELKPISIVKTSFLFDALEAFFNESHVVYLVQPHASGHDIQWSPHK